MDFKEQCLKLGITPKNICFYITPDVYDELEHIAKKNEMELHDLMRYVVDDFIINTPD